MTRLEIILQLCRAAAAAHRTAPSAHVLAAALGCSVASASDWVRSAELAGHLVVHRGTNCRVIAAPDGSWRTAGPMPSGRVVKPADSQSRWARMAGGLNRSPRHPNRADADAMAALNLPPPACAVPDGGLRLFAHPRPPSGPGCAAPPPVVAPPKPGIRHRTCQWPFGDPCEPGFRFCGAPVARKSLCAEHLPIAYVAIGVAVAEDHAP